VQRETPRQTRDRIQPVLAVVAKARRRLWLQTLVARLVPGLAILTLLASGVLLATRLGWWPQHFDQTTTFAVAGALILLLARAVWQRRPWLAAARQLDTLAGGRDQLSTALWLASEGRDDAWADVQADAANRFANTVELPRLLPWRAPVSTRWAWLPLLALLLAILAPPRWLQPLIGLGAPQGLAAGVGVGLPNGPQRFRSAAELLGKDATALVGSDLSVLNEVLPQVRDTATRQWLTQVRDVLQGVQDGRLDKRQALEMLADLEAKRPKSTELADLLDEPKKDAAQDASARDPQAQAEAERQKDQAVRDAILEAAKESAKALPEGEDKQAIEKAAAEKDLDALAKLAEKLAAKDMSDKDLEKWVKALEKFAKALGDQKVPEKFKELADRIDRLQKKRAAEGGLSHTDQERLSQGKHELEQLKRDHGDAEAAGRQVERLERGAKAAADELRRQQQEAQAAGGKQGADGKGGQGGEKQQAAQKALREQMKKAMQGASDELRRQSDGQQSRQAQRVAEARMRDLREALERAGQQSSKRQASEQGQGSQDRDGNEKSRLHKGNPGGDKEQGEAGDEAQDQGNPGEGKETGGEQEGREGTQPGKGKRGLKLGRGNLGDKSRWQEMREAAQDGQRGKGHGGQEPGSGGEGQGDAAGDKGEGMAKKASGAGRTEHLQGQEGSGADTKKTFSDAARKGFAHQGWRQVFIEYSEVAEEMLDKEHLPAGRRALVRRYFEKIRPR
jgi:hypothetical protein